MKKGLIGKKLGMTQIFDEKGNVIPVTLIEAGPCAVVQKKIVANDGYDALQLAFEDAKEKHLTKAELGHFKKSGVSPKKHLKEFRLDDTSAYEVGSVVTVDTFAAGDKVDITGITKGRGYTGCVKRWGHHILRMTHGTGPIHRQCGSMGANSTPSRVYKNKKKAKKDLKKLAKEAKQMGFTVNKHGPYYEVYDYHDYHEYDLYIQPMEYKGGQ